MIRAAIIKSGVVKNVVNVETEGFAVSRGWIILGQYQVCGTGWTYDGETFSPPPPEPPTIPDRVTSRQFKLQLLAAGLIDDVEAWIAAQDRAIQIAYETSGTFLRSEPMMQAGFAGLGYSPEQVDAFYSAAAEI
ncbi:hypothetical protein [Mesorhizobium sp. A556]